MIKSASASRHKSLKVYDDNKEAKEYPHFDRKRHSRKEEFHRKERKIVPTDRRKDADDKNIEGHTIIQSREKSEQFSSKRREKTDVTQRIERDGNYAESTEGSRRRSKHHPQDELEQHPQQNVMKRSVKSQVFKLICGRKV